MKSSALMVSLALVGLVACDEKKATTEAAATATVPTTGLPSSTAVLSAKTATPPASAVASAMASAQPTTTAPVVATKAVTVSGVQFDEPIAAACKVDKAKAYFEYDSAEVKAPAGGSLDMVAECLSKGALKGKTIEVVGHTDDRGDAEYNKKLGRSRAQSVADYLVGKGADKAKIKVISKGDKDATAKPSDDSGMAYERRVDVKLGK